MNPVKRPIIVTTEPADLEISQSRNEIIKNYDWVIPENPLEEQIYNGSKVECLCIELKPNGSSKTLPSQIYISIPLMDIVNKTSFSLDKIKKELARIQKEFNRFDKLSESQKHQFNIKFKKDEVVRAIDSICEAQNLFLGINSVAQKALKKGFTVVQKADGLYGGGRVEQLQTKEKSISAEDWLKEQKKNSKQSFHKAQTNGLESVAGESQKKSKTGKELHRTENKLKQLYKDLEETQATFNPVKETPFCKRWKFNYFSKENALANKIIKLHNEKNRLDQINLARKERISFLKEQITESEERQKKLTNDAQKALLGLKIESYKSSISELESLILDTSILIESIEEKYNKLQDFDAKNMQISASKSTFFVKIFKCISRFFKCFSRNDVQNIESCEVSQIRSREVSNLGKENLDANEFNQLHNRVKSRQIDIMDWDIEGELLPPDEPLSPREEPTGRNLSSSSFSMQKQNEMGGLSKVSNAFKSAWSKRKKRKVGQQTLNFGKLYQLAKTNPSKALEHIKKDIKTIFETENPNEINYKKLNNLLNNTSDEEEIKNYFDRNKQLIGICFEYFNITSSIDTDNINAFLESRVKPEKENLLIRLNSILRTLHLNEDIAVSKLPNLNEERHFREDTLPKQPNKETAKVNSESDSKGKSHKDQIITVSSPAINPPMPSVNASANAVNTSDTEVNKPVVSIEEVTEVDIGDVLGTDRTVFHGERSDSRTPPAPVLNLAEPPKDLSSLPSLPPKSPKSPPPLPSSPPPPLSEIESLDPFSPEFLNVPEEDDEEDPIHPESSNMMLEERSRANATAQSPDTANMHTAPAPLSTTANTASAVYHASSASYISPQLVDGNGNVLSPNGIGDGIDDSVSPAPLSEENVDTSLEGINEKSDSEIETSSVDLTPLQLLIKQMSQTNITPEEWFEIIKKTNEILPQINGIPEKNRFFRSIFNNFQYSFKNKLIEHVKNNSEMSKTEFGSWFSSISKLDIPHNEADIKSNNIRIDQGKIKFLLLQEMNQKFELHHYLNWLSSGFDKNSQKEFRKSIEEIDGKLNFVKRNELIANVKKMVANDEPSRVSKFKVLAYLIHDEFSINIKKMHENHLLEEEPKVKGEDDNISLLENITTKFEALKSIIDISNNFIEMNILETLKEAEVYSEACRRLVYLFQQLEFTNVNFENSQLQNGLKAYPYFIKEMFVLIHDDIIHNLGGDEEIIDEVILNNHIERNTDFAIKKLYLDFFKKIFNISKIYKNYESKILQQALHEAENKYTEEGEKLIESFINELCRLGLVNNELDATYEFGLPYFQKLKNNIKLIDTFKKYRIETCARETVTRLAKDKNYDPVILKDLKSRIIQKLYKLCTEDEDFLFKDTFLLDPEQIKKIMRKTHYKTKMIQSFKNKAKKANTDADAIDAMISLLNFAQLSPEKKELNKNALFELCKDISNRINNRNVELEELNKQIEGLRLDELYDNDEALFAAFECNQFILDFQALEKALLNFSNWKWNSKDQKILRELVEQSRGLYNKFLKNQKKYESILKNEQNLDSAIQQHATRRRTLSQHKKVGDIGRSYESAKSYVRSVGDSLGSFFKRNSNKKGS